MSDSILLDYFYMAVETASYMSYMKQLKDNITLINIENQSTSENDLINQENNVIKISMGKSQINTISPSSIPNPSPSTISKPSFIHEPYLSFLPYNHGIAYHAYRPLRYPSLESNSISDMINTNSHITIPVSENFNMKKNYEEFKPNEIGRGLRNDPISQPLLQISCEHSDTNEPSFKIGVSTSGNLYPLNFVDKKCASKPNILTSMLESTKTDVCLNNKIDNIKNITEPENFNHLNADDNKKSQDKNQNYEQTLLKTKTNNINNKEPQILTNFNVEQEVKTNIWNNTSAVSNTQTTVDDHNSTSSNSKTNYNIVDASELKNCTFVSTVGQSGQKMILKLSQMTPQANNSILVAKILEDKPGNPLFPSVKKPNSCGNNAKNSNVVALKRLHHDDVDENDFENLITENQIYGNKIVIKEKSQTNPSTECKGKVPKSKKESADVNLQKIDHRNNTSQCKSTIQLATNEHTAANSLTFDRENKINKDATMNDHNDCIMDVDSYPQLKFQNQEIQISKPLPSVETNAASHIKSYVLQTLLNKPSVRSSSFENHKPYSKSTLSQLPMQVRSDKIDAPECFPGTNERNNNSLENVSVAISTDKNIECNSVNGDFQEPIVSSLDLAETRRKRKRDVKVKIVKKTNKTAPSPSKSTTDDIREFRLSYKQYQMYVSIVGEKYFDESSSEESTSESDEDEKNTWRDVYRLTCSLPSAESNKDKVDFLNNFGLTTIDVKNEKELEKVEKSIKLDSINTARIFSTNASLPETCEEFNLKLPQAKDDNDDDDDDTKSTGDKLTFFNELNLGAVTKKFKSDYERKWCLTLKDRKKRNGTTSLIDYYEKLSKIQSDSAEKQHRDSINTHTKGQLQILTEIKKSVSENNNLILRAAMQTEKQQQQQQQQQQCNHESVIPALAEKNFTEIGRLSRMADKSLRIFGGAQPHNHHRHRVKCINNIPRIVSLRSSTRDANLTDTSSPATSMDEPRSSAAGAVVSSDSSNVPNQLVVVYNTPTAAQLTTNKVTVRNVDRSHLQDCYRWPGVEAVINAYKKYNEECKGEKLSLLQENGKLLRDVMFLQSEATNLSIELRQLLTRQQLYEEQLKKLQTSVDKVHYYIKELIA